jgi:cytochrome P450
MGSAIQKKYGTKVAEVVEQANPGQAIPVEDLARTYDPGDSAIARNPYPIWAAFRDSGAILHSEELGGFHIVSRYRAAREVIVDYERFVSSQRVSLPAHAGVHLPPIEYDPPVHGAMRAPLNRWLSPGAAERLVPHIRQFADDLIAQMHGKRRVDLVEEFAAPLPYAVSMRLLGLPDEDRKKLTDWVHALESLRATEPERARVAHEEFTSYLAADLARRRAAPDERPDVIAVLMDADIGGRPFTEDEMVMYYFNLVMAGLSTTTAALSMMFWYLAKNRPAQSALRNSPQKIPAAVEEMLRAFAPVPSIARTASRDTEIDGCPVKKGDKVSILFGAANNDPREFDDPAEIRLDRKPNRHMAFGSGIHRCVGSNVARTSLKTGLEQVLSNLGPFRLESEDDVQWALHGPEVRTILKLPVTIEELS